MPAAPASPRESRAEVDRAIGALDPARRAVARELCRIARAVRPPLTERLLWGNPVWSGHGRVLCLQIYDDHVNLGLWRGAELVPRFPEIEGTGKSLRHVKVPTDAAARAPSLVAIVRAAVALDRSGSLGRLPAGRSRVGRARRRPLPR